MRRSSAGSACGRRRYRFDLIPATMTCFTRLERSFSPSISGPAARMHFRRINDSAAIHRPNLSLLLRPAIRTVFVDRANQFGLHPPGHRVPESILNSNRKIVSCVRRRKRPRKIIISRFVTGSADGTVTAWDAQTGKVVRSSKVRRCRLGASGFSCAAISFAALSMTTPSPKSQSPAIMTPATICLFIAPLWR